MSFMRWGLVPHWSKEPVTKYSTFNARAETAATKPTFRDSFKRRRCLIPASGFYEWKVEDEGKRPYYLTVAEEKGLAFAGLWDRWEGKEGTISSCTILVCAPNELVASIHDRMPVILPDAVYTTWLDVTTPVSGLQTLLVPLPARDMRAWPVSRDVGNPRNDSRHLIVPV